MALVLLVATVVGAVSTQMVRSQLKGLVLLVATVVRAVVTQMVRSRPERRAPR
ncbi:hypothetical protein [Mycolicibacter senuensis]|uniref:hypothetical protein n=1 Tax=Mycolicibacter senuensis TaxID=386913 RepID=UPI0013D6B982|nr:hypothetical protein [Mycolicibacter senuensis]